MPNHALFIRHLQTLVMLGSEESAALNALPMRFRDVRKHQDIFREGERVSESCIVLSGMVCRYKMAGDGRRQILSFHFPGDMPDLQSLNLSYMDHNLMALSPVRIGLIPHDDLRAAINRHEGVRNAVITRTLVDAAILRQWLVNLGRRTALERIAHLFCECYLRLQAMGHTERANFRLPLTQSELGDATGLSSVHVNRTMQELRRMGLISSNGNEHSILDWEQLRQKADFSPEYLHLRDTALDA